MWRTSFDQDHMSSLLGGPLLVGHWWVSLLLVAARQFALQNIIKKCVPA